jgi:patatin-related protein
MTATQDISSDNGAHEILQDEAVQPVISQARATAEDVRVAMALNGGVSLAVWMGGCAVELDAARRAHLGSEELRLLPGDETPPEPGDERTIYHALCQAFDRRLVIDLMSGSSAGGINGALLAAAIDRKRRLHPDYIRSRWLELGDLETLLHSLRTPSPTSLMGGHDFFVKLRQTFRELLPTREIEEKVEEKDRAAWDEAQALLDLPANQYERRHELERDVKLDVTATDVRGSDQRFRDTWGEELVATEFRARFKFRARTDYTAQRLAMAARSSASFPLAFEPWAVSGEMLQLDGQRWLIDGGLLDNAPIRAVLDLIPARGSERPVRRYLCYVNADPPLTPTFDPDAELKDANAPSVSAEASRRRRRNGDGNETLAQRPQLPDVVNYMVSLPRKASFVDQLKAIQHAANRSNTVASCERQLLAMDSETLRTTAATLFDSYRSRRQLVSLEDALVQPGDVAVVAERLSRPGRELPWIPRTLDVPVRDDDVEDGRWGWGVRAAERVLYLLLDLIRQELIENRDSDQCAALTATRAKIYAGVQELERIAEELAADDQMDALIEELVHCDEYSVASTLCALRCLMQDPHRDPAIRKIVHTAAQTAFDVRGAFGLAQRDPDKPIAEALFGPDAKGFDAAQFRTFLERTLSIEVVRRAFAADEVVDSDQPLHFAQITPCASTLIYTSSPLRADDKGPALPDDKLTGTRWGHFAAFYRASWRANDFMWGRLDAAVRIVDMLLPPKRTAEGDGGRPPGPEAARKLAEALLPKEAFDEVEEGRGTERRWLVAETLADAPTAPEREQHRELEWRKRRVNELADASRENILATLEECISADLGDGIDGLEPRALTRALCIRAAQWEILCRELPHVIKTSRADRSLGTSVPPLELDLPEPGESWKRLIVKLREGKDTPLPQLLGADDKAEHASPLMLRTASHGALIGLSALRRSGLPGAPAFVLPRALLLPIAGMVARRSWPYPTAVAFAFSALALIVAARMITLTPGDATPWNAERWAAVLTTLLAAAGALMICLLPFWRMVKSRSFGGKVRELLWLLALAAAGGAVAVGLVLIDGVALNDVVAQTGAESPPLWLTVFALVLAGLFRFVPSWVPGPARKLLVELHDRPVLGKLSLVLFLAPWVALGLWAVFKVAWPAISGNAGDWSTADKWSARIALFAAFPLALLYAWVAVQRRAGPITDWLYGLRARRHGGTD